MPVTHGDDGVDDTRVSASAAEEFTAAVGLVLAGGLRLAEWGKDNRIPAALGLSDEEWLARKLGGQIRLSRDERREAVRVLTGPKEKGGMGLNNVQAGQVLGIAEGTVRNDRKAVCEADAQDCEANREFPEAAGEADSQECEPPPPRAPDGPIWTEPEPEPDRGPTLGDVLPPDLQLPPKELTPIQRGVFAAGRLGVLTQYAADEFAAAVVECEALSGDPQFSARQAATYRRLSHLLAAVAAQLDRVLAGVRGSGLRVIESGAGGGGKKGDN